MTVYLLTREYDHDVTTVEGVYATPEAVIGDGADWRKTSKRETWVQYADGETTRVLQAWEVRTR